MSGALNITDIRCRGDYGAWRCPPGTAARMRLRGYEFVWVREGGGLCRIADKTYNATAGDVLLLRPGQIVTWEFNASAPAVLCCFSFNASVPSWWPAPEEWPVKRHVPARDILRPLFEYVVTQAQKRDDSMLPALVAIIEMIVVTFLRGPMNRDLEVAANYPQPMHRILQWLGQFMSLTPDRKVTLEDLASISGVCSTHLCRIFQKHMGIGPLEFIYVVRITKSLVGLKAGLSVEEVARKFGFTDASHYSRRFKALFGMAPSEMHEAMQKGYKPPMPDLPTMGSKIISLSRGSSNLIIDASDGFNLTWLWCAPGHGAWGGAAGTSHSFVNGDNYTFWWLSHGKATISIDGRAYPGVAPSDVFLLQPRQDLRWKFDPFEPTISFGFSFSLGSIPRDWPSQDAWPSKRCMPTDDVLRPLFQYVVSHTPHACEQLPADLVLAVKAILLTFIRGPLDRVHMFPVSYPQPVRNVLSWMRKKLSADPRTKVTLEDVAAVAGVSPVHICRLFNQHLGQPPLATLARYRITLSLGMLRSGRKVESVAHDIGFTNATHYATRFKAIFGKSPIEVQRDLAVYRKLRHRLDSHSWLDQCEFI